jgi:mRNA-degrading endonuclease toxin of MazEF toxin-antitoxin module
LYRFGDICMAVLKETPGSCIQSGVRPVLIVSNDKANRFSPVITVIPLTGRLDKKDMPTHVYLRNCGLARTSIALAEQITAIDRIRLKERIGSIRKTVYEEQIREAVKVQLNLRGRDCAEEKSKKVHHDKRSLGQKARQKDGTDQRKTEEKKMDRLFFTLTGTKYYFGSEFLKKGMKIRLQKEPDNPYDKEAIMVKMECLGKIGYVANSTGTVLGESMSAGRLYDKIRDDAEAKVVMILPKGILCRICKKSLTKQEGEMEKK